MSGYASVHMKCISYIETCYLYKSMHINLFRLPCRKAYLTSHSSRFTCQFHSSASGHFHFANALPGQILLTAQHHENRLADTLSLWTKLRGGRGRTRARTTGEHVWEEPKQDAKAAQRRRRRRCARERRL